MLHEFKPPKLIGVEDFGDPKLCLQAIIASENTMEHITFEQRSHNGNVWGPITGGRNSESGHMKEIQKIGAPLGGLANTECQKQARAIQNKQHFAPAGTAAAASQKMAIYDKYHHTFYDLMPNDTWFSLVDAQVIADTQFDDSFLVEKFGRRFKVRSHLTKFKHDWYEVKKGEYNSLMYKKI